MKIALAHALLLMLSLAGGEPARAQPSPEAKDAWSEGEVRPFVAFSASLGALSRSDVALGYGMPHWAWVGVETGGATTFEMSMARARARLALVYVDLSVGYEHVWSYRRTALPEQPRYRELRVQGEQELRYDALSLTLSGLAPAPHGYIEWQTEARRIYGPSQALYEETLRAVVFAPWTAVARLAYGYQFSEKRAALGVVSEALWLGRGLDLLVRVGPLATWTFSPRLDIGLGVTIPVYGPDALGLLTGLWGNLRVRYRLATR